VNGEHDNIWEDVTLGWRVAATLIDAVILLFLMVVMVGIGAATGSVVLPDPSTTNLQELLATPIETPTWTIYATYLLIFAYYALLEGIAGGSVGKLALGLRVRMDDGRPATGAAIVVRNLVRIPEVFLYYIPSALSCLISKRHKRLGDFAAGTVVARRVTHAAGRAPAYPPATVATWAAPHPAPSSPAPIAPAGDAAAFPPAPQVTGEAPNLATALARFKDAVLSTAGAHEAYLRLSEMELAREHERVAAGRREEEEYSPEYVAAWYSLADAVRALAAARVAAETACAPAGLTIDAAVADQPDLVFLIRRLAPYLAPDAHERLHDAYMAVARGGEARG